MKKYGILTLFHRNYNYGGFLQAYALHKFLLNHDKNVQLIKYEYMTEKKSVHKSKFSVLRQYSLCEIIKKLKGIANNKLNYNKIADFQKNKGIVFEKFVKDCMVTSKENVSYNDILNNKLGVNGYIVGSDQVWNPNVLTDGFLLKNIPENIEKISYAASIARNSLSDLEKKSYLPINDFDYISVREKQAKDILKDVVEKQVNVVMDPVFLLTKEQWLDLAGERIINEEYVLFYLFNNSQKYIDTVKKYCNERGLKLILIPYTDGKYNKAEYKNREYHYQGLLGPKEFVNLIANAKLVFTDSFHGVSLSSILNTNFVLLKRDKESSKTSKNSRLTNILNILELEDRNVTIDEFANKELIDFEKVNHIIDEKRKGSIEFLLEALKEEK